MPLLVREQQDESLPFLLLWSAAAPAGGRHCRNLWLLLSLMLELVVGAASVGTAVAEKLCR